MGRQNRDVVIKKTDKKRRTSQIGKRPFFSLFLSLPLFFFGHSCHSLTFLFEVLSQTQVQVQVKGKESLQG